MVKPCYSKNRKEVNIMSKRKKSGSKADSYISLAAAVINLITALLILLEKLND